MTARHIVHVINSLGVSGGAEQQLVSNLNRFLDDRLRHTLVVLFEDDYGSRAHELPADVDVQYVFPTGSSRPNVISLVRALDRVASGLSPDLMHASVVDAALATRIVGRRRGIPVIETLVNISHDPIRTVDSPAVTRWKLLAHRTLDRATMRSVARFQALSTAVAESWIRHVGLDPTRVVTIPRGVPRAPSPSEPARIAARTALAAELGLPSDALILLNVGRQAAQKGQKYLLAALPAVRERFPNAHLVIAGQPGNMSPELPAAVQALALDGHVHFLGARTDVDDLLAAAHIFVFPSLFEGMGVALLQAMAAALPVVVADRAPMAGEIVTDRVNGLVTPSRDPDALAAAILELADDADLRNRLGVAAANSVAERYDSDDVAGRVEQIYLDVLGLSP